MTRSECFRPQAADRFALMKLIEAEYVSSKQSDVAFAAYAAAKLEKPFEASHVSYARNSLDIPSNRDVARAQAPDTREHRLAVLENNVHLLTQTVNGLLRKLGDVPKA